MAQKEAARGKVYTWGRLIHNETVVSDLAAKGIVPVESLDGLLAGDTLIIRAHGAPPELFAACAKRGIRAVDATCPFVHRIHPIVQKAAREGIVVFIAGQRAHPEVIGTAGWAKGQAVVLENAREAEFVPLGERGCLVAQTTLSEQVFNEIAAVLQQRISHLDIHNTICHTTSTRQQEAADLARRCTAMLVLGSGRSANTRALFQICKNYDQNCQNCYKYRNFYLQILHHI